MELIEFNAENCLPETKGRIKAASLSMNVKTGLFSLNKTAAELIGVKGTDQVAFHQDKKEKENWYVEKVKSKGFELREKLTSSVMMFNNSSLARKIAESVGFEGQSGRMLIAGQPTTIEKQRKLFGVITVSLKNT